MKTSLVTKVTADTMAGDTSFVRRVNAFLTTAFIGSSELPADECLHEAEEICGKWICAKDRSRFVDFLELYFAYTFWDGSKKPFQREAAESLVRLMSEDMPLTPENTFQ